MRFTKSQLKRVAITFGFVCFSALGATSAQSWTVGAKNFRQIFEALSVMTQIPMTDAEIQALYTMQKERLPKNGSLDELGVPSLISILSVADTYCSRWIAAEKQLPVAQRRVHRAVDFSRPASAMTPATKGELIRIYGLTFWQREPSAQESGDLSTVLDQMIGSIPTPGPSTGDSVSLTLRPLCMNMIASLSFLTN